MYIIYNKNPEVFGCVPLAGCRGRQHLQIRPGEQVPAAPRGSAGCHAGTGLGCTNAGEDVIGGAFSPHPTPIFPLFSPWVMNSPIISAVI